MIDVGPDGFLVVTDELVDQALALEELHEAIEVDPDEVAAALHADAGTDTPDAALRWLRQRVEEVDVSTSGTLAAVWAGRADLHRADGTPVSVHCRFLAEAYADRHPDAGLTVLERTLGGQWLTTSHLYHPPVAEALDLPPGEATALWSRLTDRFVAAAEGTLAVFAAAPDSRSILARVGLPALVANETLAPRFVLPLPDSLFAAVPAGRVKRLRGLFTDDVRVRVNFGDPHARNYLDVAAMGALKTLADRRTALADLLADLGRTTTVDVPPSPETPELAARRQSLDALLASLDAAVKAAHDAEAPVEEPTVDLAAQIDALFAEVSEVAARQNKTSRTMLDAISGRY